MVDKQKVETAVKMLLEAVGEDPEREGLVGTPERISRMCEELFAGTDEAAKEALSVTFNCANSDIVLEKDIHFYSLCEHHLLPFFGKAHIAYIPNGKVAGLSKLARTVDAYARRAQIQENMNAQIADAIMENLNAKGVLVVIEAEHMCMSMRGVKKPGTQTMTYVCRGEFADNPALTDRAMRMIGGM